MSSKILAQTWAARRLVDVSELGLYPSTERLEPPLLGVTLRVLRAAGMAPVRLRRAHGGWLLSVSPTLVLLQRLLIVSCCILFLTGLVFDFRTDRPVRVGTMPLTTVLWLTEVVFVLSAYIPKALSAPQAMRHLMVVLKQLKEINNGLHSYCSSSIRAQRISKIWLKSYLIWIFIIHILGYCEMFVYDLDYVVCFLYAPYYFISVIVAVWKVQWSVTIMVINSTQRALNNQLQRIVESTRKHSKAIHPEHGYLTIRHFAHCYESICDIVTCVEKDNEIFLLIIIFLSFEYLLISICNLIVSIVNYASTEVKSSRNWLYAVLTQGNWCLFHVCELLIITEPCHWMQNQTERTQYLLSRLVRSAGEGSARTARELNLFLLEVQTRGTSLAPMGVFTICRTLVASIMGCVATYLIVIVQNLTLAEIF